MGQSWRLVATLLIFFLHCVEGVLRFVCHWWSLGVILIASRNVDACESVDAAATPCDDCPWAFILWGVWYSDSTLGSLSFFQCCTFSFVPFGTIILKNVNNSAAAAILRSHIEIVGSLQYAGYSEYVPVIRHPSMSLSKTTWVGNGWGKKLSAYVLIVCGAHMRWFAGSRNMSARYPTVANGMWCIILLQGNIHYLIHWA